MNSTWLRRRLNNFLFALLVFGIIIGIVVLTNLSYQRFDGFHQFENNLEPIDPVVLTSLPHDRYKQMTDSIKTVRNMKDGFMTGSSFSFWFIGAEKQLRCDTCAFNSFFEKRNLSDHFIKLLWWKLDTGTYDNPTTYYVKNNQSYLRKGICKPDEMKDGEVVSWTCRQVDVPVPFGYNKREKAIMLPISKAAYSIVSPAILVCSIGALIFFLYFIVASVLRLLMDIRSGDPFSDENIKRLRFLSICCFAIPITVFLINVLIRLIFYRYFTADIQLSKDAWSIFLRPFTIGIIVTALYFAFRQGKKLKEEQDLTI